MSPLRWEVYGDVFGREQLLAAFLVEEDARAWVQAQSGDSWPDAVVREKVS